MSTRYLRKIYNQSCQNKQVKENIYNETDSEDEIPFGVKPKLFNVFNLLEQNSDEKDEKNEQVSDLKEESNTNKSDIKRKRKKKRNKKSQKLQKDNNSELSKDNPDEIDIIVRTVNKLLGVPKPSTSNQTITVKDWSECYLTVQHKHLNPYNELKRIFGSKTVQAEQSRTKSRGRTKNHLKKTWLVIPKDTWLPIRKTLISMTFDQNKESTNGIKYFKFEHSHTYKQIQMKFIQAVESFDPENLINIINQYGYHIDTFIQLSEYFKISEDLPNAALLIEKALLYLECAFHPLFNITTANCRVDYLQQQNRALFITLFKHMLFVGNKACYRTSLELCKFLLSLDPENDPLAAVLIIDFYAIRSKEYEWFVKFCEFWENTRNLSQLPNIAYSLALANFYLENHDKAGELIQYALMMFPGVLIPLMDKCGIQMDSKVLSHDFFTLTADQTTPSALEKLQELYVARCYNFWKESEVLNWLAGYVHDVLDYFDSKKYAEKQSDFVQLRRKRYAGQIPREVARHLILSDIPNITVSVQITQEERSMFAHDPLPPTNSINIYSLPFPRIIQDDWQNLLIHFIENLQQRRNNAENGIRALEEQHEFD